MSSAYFASSAESTTKPVAVVGGGATGLAASYGLARAGRAFRLFERTSRLGGAVQSERSEGWLVEAGPNSFQENSRMVLELERELGLENERVTASPSAKHRFIVRDGQCRTLPGSPLSLLGNRCFSWRTKLSLLGELRHKPKIRESDLSVAALVADHFGQEFVDYALNPFVSGIYAGDPHKLSARFAFPRLWQSEKEHGSLIRGMLAQAKMRRRSGEPKSKIISFRSGLQTLTDALTRTLPTEAIELGASIEMLRRESDQSWSLTWTRNGIQKTETFEKVILALPAGSLAHLQIGDLGRRPLELLNEVRYSSVASLFLGFDREAVAHPLDGFGLLIPAAEQRSILGVIFSSSLFPGRAPAGKVGLTVMVGGAQRPNLAGLDMDALLAATLPDLRTLLGVKGEPLFQRLTRWPRAIPQYELGYGRFLSSMDRCEALHPGLLIGGNVRDGIALPACLESGLRLAERALSARS